jgi:tetratricopeptide (TPR) repeat protein
LEEFARMIPQRLREMPDLPAGVDRLLQRNQPAAVVFEGLVDEGKADAGEPSWATVGRMLEEEHFRHVQRRAHFMRHVWSVPVDDYLQEALPTIAGHPYEALVRSYGQDGAACRQTIFGLARGLDLSEIELAQEMALHDELMRVDPAFAREPWQVMLRHVDQVYRDYAVLLYASRDAPKRPAARPLIMFSPHAPVAVAALTECEEQFIQALLPEWLETYKRNPVVLLALGKRAMKQGVPGQAESYLRRAVQFSPDRLAYLALAEAYKAQGKIEQWQKTLDEFLTKEDYGLDHAQVRVQIARYFMGRKEWDKATPYAEAAARTWAGWAMQCAGECAEGRQDWKRAEQWFRAVSERYESSWLEWYLWCRRTGKAELQAAQQLAGERAERVGAGASAGDLLAAGVFWTLTGRPQEALEAFRRANTKQAGESTLFFVALAADAAGKRAERDAAWRELAGHQTKFGLVAQQLQGSLARGEGMAPDAGELENLIKGLPPRQQSDVHWFVGRFLDLRGRKAEARKHLEACLNIPEGYSWIQTLAAVRLRELKAER